MGASSSPEFPYPGGTPGAEPADPVAGRPGHFAWSRWVKEFLRRLDREVVKRSGDEMTGPLTLTNGQYSTVLRTTGSGLTSSSALIAPDPSLPSHLATKQYVDARVPPYFEATFTSNASGWASLTGLKVGAVVYSILDVSSSPVLTPVLLNPADNTVYLGPSVARKLRIWYV